MEKMKIATMAVMAAVSIIVIASVLMPIIGDAQSSVTANYNQPANSTRMVLNDDASSLNLTITHSKETKTVTIGEKTYSTLGYTANFIISDQFIFYTASDGSSFFNYWNDTASKGIALGGLTVSEITISDGVATATFTGSDENTYTAATLQISWIAYRDDAGNYLGYFAENTSKNIYYENINQIRSANYIQTTNGWFSMVGNNVLVNNSTETTIDNTSTEDRNGVYVSEVSRTEGSITFDVDNSGEDYTVHPWVWVIPYNFSVEKDGMHGSLNLLSILPLMLIVAVVVAIVTIALKFRE